MKKFLFIIALLSIVSILMGQSLTGIVESAKNVNMNYKLYELNLEKTRLDYDKGVIEAINQKAEIAAQINRLSGENKSQSNLSSFYSEVLEDIFDVKIQTLNMTIAELTVKSAKLDYEDNDNLYNKGLVAYTGLKNASITYRDAQTDLEQVKVDLELAQKNFKRHTGLEWTDLELFILDYQTLLISESEWLNNSKTVGISQYNLDMAEYDIKNLSSNSSLFDRKIANIGLEQAEIDLEMTKENVLNQKNNYEDSLYFMHKQLYTSQEKVTIAKEDYDDVKNRHSKGLVSDKELFAQERSYLNTLSQYYSRLKSYWTTLSGYIISADKNMEAVIRDNLKKIESETKEKE